MGAIVGMIILFGMLALFMPLYVTVDWLFSENGRGKVSYREFWKKF